MLNAKARTKYRAVLCMTLGLLVCSLAECLLALHGHISWSFPVLSFAVKHILSFDFSLITGFLDKTIREVMLLGLFTLVICY